MIREGDIREKLFPDFPDMKVNFAEIGIGKIGKIGLAPPQYFSCLIKIVMVNLKIAQKAKKYQARVGFSVKPLPSSINRKIEMTIIMRHTNSLSI